MDGDNSLALFDKRGLEFKSRFGFLPTVSNIEIILELLLSILAIHNPIVAGLLTPTTLGLVKILGNRTDKIAQNYEEKLRIYLQEIANRVEFLDPEILESGEFFNAFSKTTKRVLETDSQEKIRRFARLLLYGIENGKISGGEFDDYLRILDDLSDREYQFLLLLKQLEEAYPRQPKIKQNEHDEEWENDGELIRKYWAFFEHKVVSEFGVSREILHSILVGLNRTGLYRLLQGLYFGDTEGTGRLLPMYYDFIEWVQLEEEKQHHDQH